ncbi:Crp/Fnr family transcriptional regulator [Chitinophaga sp. YIM B06452]|uniref:Crp/Fnr family transcriptional regulator n=1 Tax=Chitinophaga sp. YIM B06452 TaxID=3082158 RepID=UPI0031FF1CD2
MSLAGLFPIDKWNFSTQFILNNLPPEEYAALSANMTELQLKKGEVLFRQGTVPQGLFFIIRGKVKKYQVNRNGKEQIIYVANTGELLGYHAILSNERYPDSAAALEESTIGLIPKEDFLQTLENSGSLSRMLLKSLSHEFTVLVNSISVFAQRSVKERLAIALIVLREKFKDPASQEPVVIDVSRNDLANMVGSGIENVVRFLKEFKTAGMLDTKGRKIIIRDVGKLIELSGYGSL